MSAGAVRHRADPAAIRDELRRLVKAARRAPRRLREEPVLAAVVALALLLRLLPLLWGLPLDRFTQSYHPDEWKLFRTTADFPGVYVTDRRWLLYGTSVTYTLGLLLAPVKLALVGVLGMERPFDGLVQVASRLLGVSLGVGSVLLVHVVGQRLFGRAAGLAAAALLATSFYHVLSSPLATLDVPMGFLLIACVLLALRAVEVPSLGRHLALGAVTGLLIGTKVTGALVLVVPAALHALAARHPRRAVPLEAAAGAGPGAGSAGLTRRAGLLAVAALVAAGVFAVYHPHAFLEPERYLRAYREAELNWVDRLSDRAEETPRVWVASTARALGWPVLALALGGVGAALAGRRRGAAAALLLFLALYYLTWRWFLLPRYVVPVAPLFCLFAGAAIAGLVSHARGAVRLAGSAALALALGWSLALCAGGIEARLRDPRPAAARFLARALAPGTTVGLSTVSERYGWERHRWRYPKLDAERVRVVPLWEEPQVVVTTSYDLTPVRRLLRSGELAADYVLEPDRSRDWYNWSPPSPRLLRFYDRLLAAGGPYERVRTFTVPVRAPVEFPPPEIRVYRRRGTREPGLAGDG